MNEQTFFDTAFNGKNMFYRTWQSSEEAKVNIIIIHGLGEHSGRYEHFARFFNNLQCNVLAVDLFGHGNTEGIRGHCDSINDYIWQIQTAINKTAILYPNSRKTILFGHSMGGLLVMHYLNTKNPKLDGVIASAPALSTGKPVSSIKLLLGKFARKYFPTLTQSNGVELNYLCTDKSVISKYIADKLVHNKVSGELGIGLLELGKNLIKSGLNSNSPLLISHGELDKITNFEVSKDFAKKHPENITFKAWPNMMHELHNETDQTSVFEHYYKWIADL